MDLSRNEFRFHVAGTRARKYGILFAVKTIIEIPDALVADIKRYAAEHGIPMREVVERGVRQLLEGQSPTGFKLRKVRFGGKRIDAVLVRKRFGALAYKGRGG